jgi:hypothetical protein
MTYVILGCAFASGAIVGWVYRGWHEYRKTDEERFWGRSQSD